MVSASGDATRARKLLFLGVCISAVTRSSNERQHLRSIAFMILHRCPLRFLGILALCAAALTQTSFGAEKARIAVNDVVVDAGLTPATHQLKARARVKFTALDDVDSAVFELNNALRPKVADEKGKSLQLEQVSQKSSIRVQLPTTLTKGSSSTLVFDYEGALRSSDDSPVEGLKLAYVGEDTSYLLYAGRWFPMTGYNTDRFTAKIS